MPGRSAVDRFSLFMAFYEYILKSEGHHQMAAHAVAEALDDRKLY